MSLNDFEIETRYWLRNKIKGTSYGTRPSGKPSSYVISVSSMLHLSLKTLICILVRASPSSCIIYLRSHTPSHTVSINMIAARQPRNSVSECTITNTLSFTRRPWKILTACSKSIISMFCTLTAENHQA